MPDNESIPWPTPPRLWEKLKPLARQMRHEPTPAEKRLWHSVRRNQLQGFHFRRQHAMERFIVDFYCAAAKLVVEVDGTVHDYTPEEDAIRQEVLESRGIRMLRFRNEEVFENLEGVLEIICEALQNAEVGD